MGAGQTRKTTAPETTHDARSVEVAKSAGISTHRAHGSEDDCAHGLAYAMWGSRQPGGEGYVNHAGGAWGLLVRMELAHIEIIMGRLYSDLDRHVPLNVSDAVYEVLRRLPDACFDAIRDVTIDFVVPSYAGLTVTTQMHSWHIGKKQHVMLIVLEHPRNKSSKDAFTATVAHELAHIIGKIYGRTPEDEERVNALAAGLGFEEEIRAFQGGVRTRRNWHGDWIENRREG